jgi:tetraacyldisaccharide 4'-kinase
MKTWLQQQWTGWTLWHILLMPLSRVFAALSHVRKYLYKSGWRKTYRLNVPVVIVGNINVGGSGKTPVVIWLAQQLQLAGYTPGIISRGYGGKAQSVQPVFADSCVQQVGDEPVLIAQRTACPVYVSADRVAAGQALLAAHAACNVIISDDGLQHYRLERDVEIVVFDSAKGFGNGALLPAGPLRETVARLNTVDAIVSNGKLKASSKAFNLSKLIPIEMQLISTDFYNLVDSQRRCTVEDFSGLKIIAIAGIGNPERFFQQLRSMGLVFKSQAYADHYAFKAADFAAAADVVVMTEKDAVKCQAFAQANFWVLPVTAVIGGELLPIVLNKLDRLKNT